MVCLGVPVALYGSPTGDPGDGPVASFATGQTGYQNRYIAATLRCTLVAVSTQYATGAADAGFHCIEAAADPSMDGRILELHGLPAGFSDAVRRLSPAGPVKLEVRNFYLSQDFITFGSGTTWSIVTQ